MITVCLSGAVRLVQEVVRADGSQQGSQGPPLYRPGIMCQRLHGCEVWEGAGDRGRAAGDLQPAVDVRSSSSGGHSCWTSLLALPTDRDPFRLYPAPSTSVVSKPVGKISFGQLPDVLRTG